MIHEVRVVNLYNDPSGTSLLHDIHRTLGLTTITLVKTVKVYRLEGLSAVEAEGFAGEVLAETINQRFSLNKGGLLPGAVLAVEVGYKPGVMNPEVASLLKASRDLGLSNLVAADSSREYHFFGYVDAGQVQIVLDRLLLNKTVQYEIGGKPKTLILSGTPGSVETILIREMSDEGLVGLSKKGSLFLNLEEMKIIQQYFQGMGRDPTDIELETLAQTWSEHCGHKTFKARLIVNGEEREPLFKRLKSGAAKYMSNVVSAFKDNSGVLRFYEGHAVLGKVETHNSPSAIEPYGGAATGSGGVFRDIMGTGLGAKVIASTDMFCFAPPNLPLKELPPGCLHPDYLFRRVVAGVRDYGNRMGVPTNNGSVTFHPDFRAKPSVIVGSYGIAPERYCYQGKPQVGDRVFTVGGRTGRDGIHGATFSSGEMTSITISVNSSAVQIGNAIEEKRMADALLIARDKGLIRAITDCGAGGFSSAIGEIGSSSGVRVELAKAPLKYSGLSPWEIWISESQERMVCAVPSECSEEFLAVCASYNVEATDLGEFTGDNTLVVAYEGKVVCELSMEFLHDGLPQRVMVATYKPHEPEFRSKIPQPTNWLDTYCKVLGHWDICSKEPIVRQYDHGVQGTNALPPFTGVNHDGPNDAVVLVPLLGKPYGLVISHGINPVLMGLDPYNGGLWAITEALANLVAVGGDPREVGLIDNFIWPFPDEKSLGALDKAVQACVDGMDLFGVPFISGKDSLSSTYRFPDGTKLEIPPVLCVSAFGRIPDVTKTVTSDFKRAGSNIVFLGQLDLEGMAGSVYAGLQPDSGLHYYGDRVPWVDLRSGLRTRFIQLHEQIVAGNVLACHDVSQGGVAVTLAEMCFGGQVGADINISKIGIGTQPTEFADSLFFNETSGCFLLEVAADKDPAEMFEGVPWKVIGTTISEPVIRGRYKIEDMLFVAPLELLRAAWQRPMKEVFNA